MNNPFKISGVLKVIGDTTQISERFTKRDFVLTIDLDAMYPQHVSFQLTQDKCSLLDNISVNDTVTVSFNIRGREWTNPQGEVKYFNSLEAWRIETVGQPSQEIPQGGVSAMNLKPATPVDLPSVTQDGADDLPF